MKQLTAILIVVIVIYSCRHSEPVKELSEKEKQEHLYKLVDDDLSQHNEKIILLSQIKRISYDTLYLILKNYNAITYRKTFSQDSSRHFYEKTIDLISQKFNVSKSKITSIIFSYKYEMLTKEDIIDEYEMENERDMEMKMQENPEDEGNRFPY